MLSTENSLENGFQYREYTLPVEREGFHLEVRDKYKSLKAANRYR